jgi:hypothetical protein
LRQVSSQNLARPKANLTGSTFFLPQLNAKRYGRTPCGIRGNFVADSPFLKLLSLTAGCAGDGNMAAAFGKPLARSAGLLQQARKKGLAKRLD